jgi:propionyl-CoA carboxylase alpha chain
MLRDVAAVSAALHYRGAAIRHSRPGRRPLPAKGEPFSLTLEGRDRIENFEIVATSNGDGVTVTFADGLTVDVESDWQPPEPTFAGRIDGRVLACQVRMENGRIIVDHAGTRAISKALSREAARLSPLMRSRAADAAGAKVISPMPGLLNDLLVSVGDEVVTGQVLAVVEAMKMEISIRAEINGRVAEVFVKPGTMIDCTVALLLIDT